MNAPYFTYTNHCDLYSYYCKPAHNISIMQFKDHARIVFRDATGDNSLSFNFPGELPVGMLHGICQIVISISMRANGSARRLVEDHAVLLLMKEFDLNEIMHVRRNTDDLKLTTLWTQDDAYALNS